MKHVLLSIIMIAFLASCATPATAVPTVDVGAIQTAAVQTSQASVPTLPPPTETPLPPTQTSIPPTVPPVTAEQHFAWNNIASQESGGLKIEIARFVLADKSTIKQDFTMGGFTNIFDDRPVVAEIIFKITNPTDKKISIYPDQGVVIAGSEQIQLFDFFLSEFGDTISGEIYPGVTVIGGIWFGFKRTSVNEITSVTLTFSGPSDENLNTLGPDFNFILDLTNRQDQPLPNELK